MTKKRVSLDVFEESVLPMLEQKHKSDATKIQEAIDQGYDIYETVGEGDNAKERAVKFSVSAPAKADDNGTEDERIAKAVQKAIGEIQKANPAPKNPLGVSSKGADGKMIIPATVKRFGPVRNFKNAIIGGYDQTERAYRFGHWVLACNGNENSKRFCEEQGIDVKLHYETSNTAGGYLVPTEFSSDLIDLRLQYGVFRRNARIRPMASDTLLIPRRTGGLTAYFIAEAAAATESSKTWDQIQLVAKDLMAITRMTSQLSDDAVISIGDDLAGEIAYAFSKKEDDCGFNGDGTSTYGGIVGVVTALGTINGVDDGGGMVLGAGNNYSELTLANFNSVVARCPSYARMGAKWYASPSFNDGVMQKLAYAAGGNTQTVIAGGAVQTFLGYPIELAEVLPVTEANSQICALFGDLSKAASFGDRQQDRIDFSREATVGGQSLWERNEIGVRGTERFDIVAHDLGTATVAGPVVCLITASS